MIQQYIFTPDQLNDLLHATIGMYLEYHDVHGYEKENATFAAVNEMFEGLDGLAELELPTTQANETLEVLELAIEALREQADKYHFDQRAVDMLGDNLVPSASRKRAKKRSRLLEAISEVMALKQKLETE